MYKENELSAKSRASADITDSFERRRSTGRKE